MASAFVSVHLPMNYLQESVKQTLFLHSLLVLIKFMSCTKLGDLIEGPKFKIVYNTCEIHTIIFVLHSQNLTQISAN